MPAEPHATGAVFLSYASQDAGAAKRICDALRAAGVEVWFDQSELVGGDSWDAKIRGQIGSCALFVPLISANTQARLEGYFRLEWKLAAQRTHTMADEKAFLLPILIDGTRDAEAKVPPEFRAVQWTKLTAGETPPSFSARVAELLAGELESGRPRPGTETRNQAAAPSRKSSRSRLIPAILGVAALATLAIWQPWRASPPAAVKPGSAPSEAQKLVAQARQILENGDELNREIYFLAEDLVKRAVALAPADAEAWTLSAEVSYRMAWLGVDASQARVTTMRQHAERAVALAPASLEARLVRANVRVELHEDLEATLATLLQLEREAPENWRVQRALGQAYRFLKRPEPALRALQRARELSGNDPGACADLANVMMTQNRFAEAEAVVTEALSRQATGRLMAFDVLLKTQWRGDIAAATAIAAKWPDWLLREDRGAHLAWRAWLWNRQPEQALAVAQLVPRDYLHDYYFSGPRAVLTARAQEMAGHAEAAQADWREVVQLTDRELASGPGDAVALMWKAWALARLGDLKQAQAIGKQLQQQNVTANGLAFVLTTIAPFYATVGMNDAAFAELRSLMKPSWRYGVARAALELEPAYEPLRSDPRYQELLRIAPAPEAPKAAAATAVDDKSVAVLAFANLSDDKGNEYFSDGISEELLNVLAKVPGLKVTARTSAFYFKGKEVQIPEIARQLGVAYVVEGSVRKAGDKVRITAQLIKAADGFHVWSDTFTRDLKDIFAVQDEIAGLIAQQLQLKLGGAARVAKAVNPEAHQLVLEGRHYLTLRTAAGFDQAERVFSQALKLDPQFAQAQAGLATTTALRGRYRLLDGVGRVEEFDQLAIAQSRLALQMDPSLAEPHAAIGFVFTDHRQLAEAEQEFQKAFAANPNYATAYHWHSHVFGVQGRLDLALKEIGLATTLDPLSFIMTYIQGFYTCDTQRYAEALVVLDRAAALRNDPFLPLEADRARMLLELGRKAEALAVARKVLGDPRLIASGWYSAGEALHVLHQAGETVEAARLAGSLIPAMPPGSYQRGYALCALGNFREGLPQLATMPVIPQDRIYFHPMFDPVRDTPDFRQLLVKLGCVEEYKVARETLARMLKEQAGK